MPQDLLRSASDTGQRRGKQAPHRERWDATHSHGDGGSRDAPRPPGSLSSSSWHFVFQLAAIVVLGFVRINLFSSDHRVAKQDTSIFLNLPCGGFELRVRRRLRLKARLRVRVRLRLRTNFRLRLRVRASVRLGAP